MTPEEIEAMRQSLKGNNAAPPAVDPEPDSDPASNTAKPDPVVPTEGNSSLKNDNVPPTPVIAADPVVPPTSKSFEDYLVERTAGKFKKWEDVESVINAPKEVVIDDEEVRHWYELKKKGVKLDREFFELQNLNLDSLKENPKNILLQAMRMKPENKNLSEKTLNFQLEKKYGLSGWIEKEEVDFSDEDYANRDLMLRDAQLEYTWLNDYKKERTFIPEADPVKAKEAEAAKAKWQADWEQFVDGELSGKVSNLSVLVNPETKESFDYKVSETDRKEITDLMKLLPKNVYALFNRFTETDSQGNPQINHAKVAQMILKDKLFDQAVLKARSDGEAEGARKEIEKIKNVNFKPGDNGGAGAAEPSSEKQALASAIKAQGRVF